MRFRLLGPALLALLVCIPGARTQGADARPRLLVVLVVDQLRTDYLQRYGERWTGGLKRLTREGAWFIDAAFPYLNTVTCAGHATIGTGRFPRRHGMVLNGWWDRTLGRTVLCTEASDASTVTPAGVSTAAGSHSAARLQGNTLASRVKAAGGRVVTISLKPRSAINLAGPRSDATIWFGGTGTFVTSTAYSTRLPAFVTSVLATSPIDRARATPWSRVLPVEGYLGADDAPGERPPSGWSTVFPHPLEGDRFVLLWQHSPAADAYLAQLATAALDEYKLGADDRVDFLGVSFSTLDIVGHAFGPESHEVQDILAHLDQTIGRLLETLDRRVGRGRYVVALTSDHGVAPIPEQSVAAGLSAGRIDPQAVSRAVNAALEPYIGGGAHVAALLYTDLYFRPGVWAKVRGNESAVAAVKKAILSSPGVARVFTADELRRDADDADAARRAAALSWFEGRSGDVILVPSEYWIASSAATTHGTLHPYDQRVPVIFFGGGIGAGTRSEDATPADIAPTLARMSGLRLDGTDGRALVLPVAGTGTP